MKTLEQWIVRADELLEEGVHFLEVRERLVAEGAGDLSAKAVVTAKYSRIKKARKPRAETAPTYEEQFARAMEAYRKGIKFGTWHKQLFSEGLERFYASEIVFHSWKAFKKECSEAN